MKFKIRTVLQFWVLAALASPQPAPHLFAQASSILAQAVSGRTAHRQEAGLPFIQNFDPKEYNASAQNVEMVRDHRGVMYFANISGVLEYDGVSWRLITLPNSAAVFSLGIDENGVVYVGAEVELGYLAPDALGELGYVSLLDILPQENHDFHDIRKIITTSHGVYFSTKKFLFRLENFQPTKNRSTLSTKNTSQFRVWNLKSAEQSAFGVRDKIYIPQDDVGLMSLVGDSLRLAPGGEQFKNARIDVMLPFPDPAGFAQPSHVAGQDKYILIGTHTSNLILYDGVSFKSFNTEADVFLRENQLSRGVNLADGTFALGTQRGGVAIIDQQGRLRQIINKASGLRHDDVNALYRDPADGALWLALDNGLARVDIPAPLSIYSEKLGINGAVLSILRHQGRIYAATLQQVYSLSVPSTRNTYPIFQPVFGITAYSGALLAIEKTLFAATTDGVYRIEEDRAIQICDLNSILLYQSPSDPKRVYIGGGGMALLQEIDGQWRFTGRITGFSGHVISIVEDEDGIVWLGTRVEGVLRVKMPASTSHIPTEELAVSIQRYGLSDGLPVGTVYVCSVNGQVLFATQKGLRRFDPPSRSFVPDSTFGLAFADTTRYLYRIIDDAQGRVWIPSGDQNEYEIGAAAPRKDGSYSWQSIPALRLADMSNTWAIFPEANGVVWFGHDDGIVRFDPAIATDYAVNFPALVRRVVVSGDSAIYWGAAMEPCEGCEPEQGLALPYAHNTMRFEYAAPSYDAPSRNQYQVFLAGFDEDWSAWTGETKKDYTNLPGGDYRFRVRAKNIYNHLSSEGVYELIILPPWYRTWWAYGSYAVIFGLLLLAADRIQRRRILKRERKRSRRREAELRLKNRLEISQMETNKLKELDQMKSHFFTNISHEFRTPLTLIMGQVESELATPEQQKDTGKLQMALRNAKQLLQLINQLLDLSKLEAGSTTLSAAPGNIVPLLKSLTYSYESLAKQKQIDLRFECEYNTIVIDFAKEKIEKIMYNLLSNGMKFTKAGGKLHVRLAIDDEGSKASDTLPVGRHLLIIVKDTGIGIPEDRLPYIFDRFYQVDASQTREHEGTGIGLALTKELVELHGGAISAESAEGFGTTFTVSLPHVSEAGNIAEEHDLDPGLEPQGAMVRQQETGTQLLDSSAESPETSKNIILIVEDNADVREYVRQSLSDLYRVIEAKDGEDGFTQAREYIPDLIVSDVMMPKIDGYEMARTIRADELTSHIPIIMLTAKGAEDEKLEGLETGVDAYLVKPFSTRELQVRVRKLIEMRRKLREQKKQPLRITSSEIAVTPVDEQFLKRIQTIVEENIADENFEVEELCRKVGISERQLYRKLRALLNCTPAAYVRLIRLDRAKQLLRKGAGSVSEITFQVGYANTSAFARAFREVFGQSPSEILKKQ